VDPVRAYDEVRGERLGALDERLAVRACANAIHVEPYALEQDRVQHRLLQRRTQDSVCLPPVRLIVDPGQQGAARVPDLGPSHARGTRCNSLPKP
jgi:hypothetical protein